MEFVFGKDRQENNQNVRNCNDDISICYFLYFFSFFTTPNIPTKPNKILLPQFHIKFVAKIVKFKNFSSCIRKTYLFLNKNNPTNNTKY